SPSPRSCKRGDNSAPNTPTGRKFLALTPPGINLRARGMIGGTDALPAAGKPPCPCAHDAQGRDQGGKPALAGAAAQPARGADLPLAISARRLHSRLRVFSPEADRGGGWRAACGIRVGRAARRALPRKRLQGAQVLERRPDPKPRRGVRGDIGGGREGDLLSLKQR